jgi:hypothetical protein
MRPEWFSIAPTKIDPALLEEGEVPSPCPSLPLKQMWEETTFWLPNTLARYGNATRPAQIKAAKAAPCFALFSQFEGGIDISTGEYSDWVGLTEGGNVWYEFSHAQSREELDDTVHLRQDFGMVWLRGLRAGLVECA